MCTLTGLNIIRLYLVNVAFDVFSKSCLELPQTFNLSCRGILNLVVGVIHEFRIYDQYLPIRGPKVSIGFQIT